jgi:hypothetical protein
MGMLAKAEAPAANRKKVRREKPVQSVGSTDEVINKTPWDQGGLNRDLLWTRAQWERRDCTEVRRGKIVPHVSRYPRIAEKTRKKSLQYMKTPLLW